MTVIRVSITQGVTAGGGGAEEEAEQSQRQPKEGGNGI
jgi:hypothetical protein